MKTTPTTFETSFAAVAKAAPAGADVVRVTVQAAPVWHAGDVVAEVTGTFPAIRLAIGEVTHYATLLDTGEFSALAEWRVR